jgi:hypothetical protein
VTAEINQMKKLFPKEILAAQLLNILRTGSLPCPQEPTTAPFPEPDQSNPRSTYFASVLPSNARTGLLTGLFNFKYSPPYCFLYICIFFFSIYQSVYTAN